jgi:hypothetical protein
MPTRRRLARAWGFAAAGVVLIAWAGWVAWQWEHQPQPLRTLPWHLLWTPHATYVEPSRHAMYPRLADDPVLHALQKAGSINLDDLLTARFSPSGRYLAIGGWAVSSGNTTAARQRLTSVYATRNGALPLKPLAVIRGYGPETFLSDACLVCDDHQAYSLDGRRLLPYVEHGVSYTVALGIRCTDPDILPLRLASGAAPILGYSLRRRRVVWRVDDPATKFAVPGWGSLPTCPSGMVLTHGRRTVVVVETFTAVVLDDGKELARFPMSGSRWRWDDDGTVWHDSGGVLTLLRWREGTPSLVSRRLSRNTPTAQFCLCAAAQDGALTAWIDYLPAGQAMARLGDLTKRVGLELPAPRDRWRLTVQRGKRTRLQVTLVSDSLHYTQSVVPTGDDAQHALAFAPDGQAIAWMLGGTTNLYRIPR